MSRLLGDGSNSVNSASPVFVFYFPLERK